MVLELPDDAKERNDGHTGDHDPGARVGIESGRGLGQDDVVGGAEARLDKHIKAKHHHVRAADRGGEDDRDALVAFCKVAAQDNEDGEKGVADDIVAEVGGGEDDGDDYETKKSQLKEDMLDWRGLDLIVSSKHAW